MQTFLVILLIAAMLATVVALVRGIVIFLKTTEADLKGEGPSVSATRSNKMMQARILFQAIAVIIVVLLLMSTGRG
ncbi:twin transmembrane helix small protein [Sphingomonas japonica]|uniref:Archaellum biogenesis protein FlaJ (TadC family) n=1 Tax=Sphingomonas japonica TaxID=511662 RepID=A0ABX0TZR3_9SPHN|nr:twin transmembrane helix small protein [Sphingomonas japonica]NIJ23805.1 archaellum biogenesis protein FlaJ (TadC family) [Sphingomonas japonica]